MHIKDMWLWATRKHGSGHRGFLEGVFLKCSLRGCIMKTRTFTFFTIFTVFYVFLHQSWSTLRTQVEDGWRKYSQDFLFKQPNVSKLPFHQANALVIPKVHSSFYCFYRHVTLPDSPPYQTAYILDISGSCRWFNMGDIHSNRFQCVPMCLLNVFSIGCSMDMFGSQKKQLTGSQAELCWFQFPSW